jgi:hypothetical protein
VSNYRVCQVLALPKMQDRRLRLLLALAAHLGDDTREVRISVPRVAQLAGLSEKWAKIARDELAAAGDLAYEPGRGAGNRTLWTLLCLPEKGVPTGTPFSRDRAASGKGGPSGSEKRVLPGKKRGTRKRRDQGKRDPCLGRR